LPSRDFAAPMHAPFFPLFSMALREVTGGRALWTLLLLMCPLVGYSFFQALSLYGEASQAGLQSAVLATSLSPLDGVLVPTFGSAYVAITLLFPFVAREKETGVLRLLVQLPYGTLTLMLAKFLAVLVAWAMASSPVLSTLVVWKAFGGHLSAPETLNLVLGHLVYGALIGAIALFAAAIAESSATAAIITLAFTIGSWVLDFTLAGQPGILDWAARLSLTQVLRPFEQGLLPTATVLGVLGAIAGFLALAGLWVPPGLSMRAKLVCSTACLLLMGLVILGATQVKHSFDVSEDRRNSLPLADEDALRHLASGLIITVHLAPEDPRYVDLRRNVLAKLERVMPDIAVQLAGGRQSFGTPTADERYGEIELRYGTRSDVTRSTSPRELLPIIYTLAGTAPPPPIAGRDYPGYPLIANAQAALAWFLVGLPLLIVVAWWWSRRSPRVHYRLLQDAK
jgi:ABC-2 type transport system permease protein